LCFKKREDGRKKEVKKRREKELINGKNKARPNEK